jgi:Peptidase family S51
MEQDVIYVGGESTSNMLAIWRLRGIDEILSSALDSGTILYGSSAEGVCWFESGLTDSLGFDGILRPLRNGLGFLSGSHAPHFDRDSAGQSSPQWWPQASCRPESGHGNEPSESHRLPLCDRCSRVRPRRTRGWRRGEPVQRPQVRLQQWGSMAARLYCVDDDVASDVDGEGFDFSVAEHSAGLRDVRLRWGCGHVRGLLPGADCETSVAGAWMNNELPVVGEGKEDHFDGLTVGVRAGANTAKVRTLP